MSRSFYTQINQIQGEALNVEETVKIVIMNDVCDMKESGVLKCENYKDKENR